MTKQHPDSPAEPFFITQDVAAELTAAGYEFAPPGHARTASIRELFGWQPGETLARTPVSADGPFNSGVSLS